MVRDITLPAKVHRVKAMVFPVVMYGYETWTIKKAQRGRIDVFELWCWRRLLRVPWTARRSNQSILKEISPEYSLEGPMLKLKLHFFGNLVQKAESLEKTLMLLERCFWTDWRQEEKEVAEDEMVTWHHQLDGREFEQTQEDSGRQRSMGESQTQFSKWATTTTPGRKQGNMAQWYTQCPQILPYPAIETQCCLLCKT